MMANPLFRKLVTVLFVAGVAAGMIFAVKARYGAYGDYYYVTADLPRAGQLMRVGADVRQSGVVIGKVSAMELVDRHVRLTLQIEPEYRVPADADAVVDLKTLLGDKYVDLRFDTYTGPWLQDRDRITGYVGPELEDVLQEGVEVFEAVNPDDLATVVGELATGARGHGDAVARSLDAQAELSTTFAETLDPQLRALRDFDIIFGELEEVAPDMNFLADAVNQGVPVYASERAQASLRRVLDRVVPMADDLADLLIYDRPAWDRLIEDGDTVLQTIADHSQGLHDLVDGLGTYVHRLGGVPPYLRDGSAAAPFANFFAEEDEGGHGGGGGGGESFEDAVAQLCAEAPPAERRHIPICREMGP
jgi:phospholipid/cholesterol/gamma-HCH transport system substrate-binding protein